MYDIIFLVIALIIFIVVVYQMMKKYKKKKEGFTISGSPDGSLLTTSISDPSTYISQLTYNDYDMNFDVDQLKVAPALKQHLNDIRVGNVPDKHNWLEKLPS